MRKIDLHKGILIIILLFATANLFSQEKCSTAVISHRIDSICKANDVKLCIMHQINGPDWIVESGNFRFDDCFLIINEKHYFDLTKLIHFYIDDYYGLFRKSGKALFVDFQYFNR
jgi:hypothetical protein